MKAKDIKRIKDLNFDYILAIKSNVVIVAIGEFVYSIDKSLRATLEV